jgi:hypothetical protein
MFNTFVTPSACWQGPRSLTVPTLCLGPDPSKAKPRHWSEFAGEDDWQNALVEYLREHRRTAVKYWTCINQIVGASVQGSRTGVRSATRQVLTALQALLKSKRVMRYKRKYLIVLDTGDQTLTLEEFFLLPGRTTGRCTADSANLH